VSFFDTAHEDRSTAVGTAGPRLGFFGAMEAAYDAQVRAWSQLGVSAAFEEVDNEQQKYITEKLGDVPELRTLRSANRRRLAAGGSVNYYQGMARFFEGGGDPDVAGAIDEADNALDKLRDRLPELLNYRELWGVVKERAAGAEHRWESATTTWPGTVGGFLGGAAAAVDPRTDPINTVSLGVAPGGQTLARRLAMAGGSNALAEAVNQITGVQENRRLLGLEHSASQAMQQIMFAGSVGTAFQGGGELLMAGARRLRSTALPDAPPRDPGTGFVLVGDPYGPVPGPRDTAPRVADRVPAWAGERLGMQPVQPGMRPSDLFGDFWGFAAEVRKSEEWMATPRGAATVERETVKMQQHLERWDVDGLPAAETRLWSPPLRADVEAPWYIRPPEEMRSELGRHYDPDLYRELDKLDADIVRLSSRADELRRIQQLPRSQVADETLDKVQELQQRIDAMTREREGKSRAQQRQTDKAIRLLTEEQREMLRAIQPDAQRLSDAQLEMHSNSLRLTDLRMRRQELTPLQQHAEDVARGVMDENMPPVDALMMMDRMVAYGIDIAPPIRKSVGNQSATQSSSRDLQSESLAPQSATQKPGEAPAEAVVRSTREAAAEQDEGEVLMQRIREALSDEQRTDVAIGDQAYPIDKDGVKQADWVTIVDFVEKDGAQFAKVRYQDGKLSFWPADKFERVPMIDLGRGLMSLEQQIPVGVADDGSPRYMKVRDIIREIENDEAMVQAMTTCARA